MKVQLSSLYWENYNPNIVKAHQEVMSHLDLKVNYTKENIDHGEWCDDIIRSSKADVIGIIEPDLAPLCRGVVDQAIKYVRDNDTMLGVAQVANHIGTKSHIYAAPAFFFITKSFYEKIGSPSFVATRRGDVGEELSYAAEERGLKYRTLYPTHFEREPEEGVWPLGSYGYYGIGTVFNDSVYHLYQGRYNQNAELFIKRCNEITNNTFTTAGFHSSTTFKYPGKVVA